MLTFNFKLFSNYILLVVIFLLNPINIFAAAGDLDPTFGVNGIVTTDFSGDVDSAFDIAIQIDGKLVLAGSTGHDINETFAVARYNSDGTLDSSFSEDGKAIANFYGFASRGEAVAIQNDGKIIVAGGAANGNNLDIAIARFNSDGSLDTSFSQDGLLLTNITQEDYAYDVLVDFSGKILVAGSTYDGLFTSLFALARYNSDGTPDLTFSGGGIVTTSFQGWDGAASIALQIDGKIIAAGASGSDLAIARYNTDGSLDLTFSGDGRERTHFAGSACDIRSIAIQNDGKIVAVGTGYEYTPEREFFVMVRYNLNGRLDIDFAENGVYTTTLWGKGETLVDVAVQNDGKIVAAGRAWFRFNDWEAHSTFAIARFNNDGSLDSNFSGDGRVNSDVNLTLWGAALAIQNDGKIVIAGIGRINAEYGDFAITRYIPEGSPCDGTQLFCDDFEDGVVSAGWTIHKQSWSESEGFMIAKPLTKKAEIIASPVFGGCQVCSVETALMSTGGLVNRTSMFAWYLDKQNSLELIIKQSTQTVLLKHRVGGVVSYKTKFRPASEINPNTLYQVKMEFDGLFFKVYWVDMSIPVLQFDPSDTVPSGTFGFRVQDLRAYFSYVVVN